MRCYFNLTNATEVLRDEHGVEVPDLDTARTEALRVLDELRQGDPGCVTDWEGWRLDITDAAGAVMSSINLDMISALSQVASWFGTA